MDYKVPDGEDIFSTILKLYGSLEFYGKFIQDNYTAINSGSLSPTVVYDPSLAVSSVPDLELKDTAKTTILSIKLQEGQSIFDGVNMTYGDIGMIYKLIQDSDIDSINETDLAQKTLTYDSIFITDNANYNVIKSKGFVFATEVYKSRGVNKSFLQQQNGFFILQQDGSKIII